MSSANHARAEREPRYRSAVRRHSGTLAQADALGTEWLFPARVRERVTKNRGDGCERHRDGDDDREDIRPAPGASGPPLRTRQQADARQYQGDGQERVERGRRRSSARTRVVECVRVTMDDACERQAVGDDGPTGTTDGGAFRRHAPSVAFWRHSGTLAQATEIV